MQQIILTTSKSLEQIKVRYELDIPTARYQIVNSSLSKILSRNINRCINNMKQQKTETKHMLLQDIPNDPPTTIRISSIAIGRVTTSRLVSVPYIKGLFVRMKSIWII